MKRQAKVSPQPRRSERSRPAKYAERRIPGSGPADKKQSAVVGCIQALPAGSVSSYGAIARAAGWAGAARQVVKILQRVPRLPWHRVVGSGGAIKLIGENGAEQRFRLKMEGVTFRGARVDMARHEFRFSKIFPKKRWRA